MVGRTNLVSVGVVGKKECRHLSIPGKNSVGHFPALEKKKSATFQPSVSATLQPSMSAKLSVPKKTAPW